MKIKVFGLALLISFFHTAAFAVDTSHSESHLEAQKGYSKVQKINDVLTIENATAKATIPGTKVSSGYMKIINSGDKAIHLTSANSAVAMHTEFHRMFMRDNRMAMRKEKSLEVPANGSIVLDSKGYHLMFMGIKNSLQPKQVISVTMTQDTGEQFDVLLSVIPMKKF